MESPLRNLRLPVIGAPMFLVSGPELVIAQCRAGIVGAFPALNARSTAELRDWLERIRSAAATGNAAPYAVNLIVHQRNARLDDDLDACIEARVPLIITSMSSPARVVERVHAYGGQVFHDASTVKFARKAADAGVDGLVLVCAGAGGHTGSLSPFAFVGEVKRFFSGPLVLAGSITTGGGVLAARAMGCDFAYMGTRFIASSESLAPAAYKAMVVSSTLEDIVSTPFFSGVTANYLAPSIRAAGLDPQNLPLQDMPSGYTRRSEGPKAWKDIWGAGQGVGAVGGTESAADIVEQLITEYRNARDRCLTAG